MAMTIHNVPFEPLTDQGSRTKTLLFVEHLACA